MKIPEANAKKAPMTIFRAVKTPSVTAISLFFSIYQCSTGHTPHKSSSIYHAYETGISPREGFNAECTIQYCFKYTLQYIQCIHPRRAFRNMYVTVIHSKRSAAGVTIVRILVLIRELRASKRSYLISDLLMTSVNSMTIAIEEVVTND